MPQVGEHLFEAIARDVAGVFAEVAQEAAGQVKENLSVPVTYTRGPRGGKIAQRSKRGEHPRRETGALQGDITGGVVSDGLSTRITLDSTKVYAGRLQNELDRPILSDVAEPFETILADRVASIITHPTE